MFPLQRNQQSGSQIPIVPSQSKVTVLSDGIVQKALMMSQEHSDCLQEL